VLKNSGQFRLRPPHTSTTQAEKRPTRVRSAQRMISRKSMGAVASTASRFVARISDGET